MRRIKVAIGRGGHKTNNLTGHMDESTSWRCASMLVLSRKPGEQIVIGKDVALTVVAVQGQRITLGIEAPRGVRIVRGELKDRSDEPTIVWSPPPPDEESRDHPHH